MDFITWLSDNLSQRGWSHAKFADISGVSRPLISQTLRGDIKPSANFCIAVAVALDVPPESVLRLAGILPGEPAPTDQPGPVTAEILRLIESVPPDQRRQLLEVLRLADGLPPEQRQQLLDYAQFLNQKNR